MKIAILTSGGDAPGMNAAIRSVTRCALTKGMTVYGIQRGFAGLLDGEFHELTFNSVSDKLQRGGTFLQTARCAEFRTIEGQKRGAQMLKTFGIDYLVVIGGDGSLTGGLSVSKLGIPVMGIPGTIDNDLGYTDFTIGFDTAVNTVLDCISKIRDTSSSHERTTIIEVMGRHCGDIALYAGMAGGAEAVLIPEIDYDINDICQRIILGRNRGKVHNVLIKAEGTEMKSDELAALIEERTGVEARAVILAYLQRGGSPTARDRMLATRCGEKAVQLIEQGSDSRAIGCAGNEIIHYPLEEALQMKREFNKDLYDLAVILS
ncbi:MAG: 6-phosphofructokinase [Bacillota bacterium]|nr:6-phosphofructokinase [Bacillota bacterium]